MIVMKQHVNKSMNVLTLQYSLANSNGRINKDINQALSFMENDEIKVSTVQFLHTQTNQLKFWIFKQASLHMKM